MLQEWQAAVSNSSGVDAWLSSIAAAKASAAGVDAARNNATGNPFTVIQARLAAVTAAVADIKGQKLSNLSDRISRFNGMWHNNASLAFDDLLAKAQFVNGSILLLPSDVNDQVNMLADSLNDVNALYQGNDSLTDMPGNINKLGDNLTMPDTSNLVTQLQDSEQKLNTAGPDLAQLIQTLDNLTQALIELKPVVQSIGAAMAAFDADNSTWPALQADLQANGTVIATAVTLFAAADLGSFIRTTAGQIKGNMDGSSTDMNAQLQSVTDVQKSIADFDMQTFTDALASAETAYNSFGGDPSTVSSWQPEHAVAAYVV